MKTAALIIALLFGLSAPTIGLEQSFGGVELLRGYSANRETSIDTNSWIIRGKNGFTIHCESGPSEGRAVDSRDIGKYVWYREQTIRGQRVLIALTKPDTRSEYDLDAERNLPPGNVLLVTFPLGARHDHAANFVGKVANQEETIDMLLMALTFDPSKGTF
jgi:hypothetical protein